MNPCRATAKGRRGAEGRRQKECKDRRSASTHEARFAWSACFQLGVGHVGALGPLWQRSITAHAVRAVCAMCGVTHIFLRLLWLLWLLRLLRLLFGRRRGWRDIHGHFRRVAGLISRGLNHVRRAPGFIQRLPRLRPPRHSEDDRPPSPPRKCL